MSKHLGRAQLALRHAMELCSEEAEELLFHVHLTVSEIGKADVAVNAVEVLEGLSTVFALLPDQTKVTRQSCAPLLAEYWTVRTNNTQFNHSQVVLGLRMKYVSLVNLAPSK